jgi:uncharacterized membrane protein
MNAPAMSLLAAAFMGMSVACAHLAAAEDGVSDGDIESLIETHCVSCHAAAPTHPAYIAPAGQFILESLDDLRANGQAVSLSAVESDLMPLGNETGMTDDERALLGAWLAQQ